MSHATPQTVMRVLRLLLAIGFLVPFYGASAQDKVEGTAADLAKAEAFIDAFYSFDDGRLNETLSSAQQSIPEILYYQGWAQGGHYLIVERQPCRASDSEVACSITVEDDLIKALGFTFHVTDTFHLTISNGIISSVSTTSNDPPEFHDAEEWVKTERAERFQDSCRGYFAGGPTPQDCVKTMVAGFKEYAATHMQARSK